MSDPHQPDHHHHDHHHVSLPGFAGGFQRSVVIGMALNLGFVGVEAVCGVLSGSMALLADAGHNMSDVLALLLA